MVMLVSAMLVESMIWKDRRKYFEFAIALQSVRVAASLAVTLVTPSGTGWKTLCWSSRGIEECRGRILYALPPKFKKCKVVLTSTNRVDDESCSDQGKHGTQIYEHVTWTWKP